MEKAPIKKFAVEARKKLKADVTFQLERYGITENGIVEPQTSTDKELVFDLGNGNTQTIKGERYVNQYRNLAAHVRGFYTTDEPKKELEQFIEEIAYTWFNRLIAIRFMEVNRYLPVRVLSSEITGQKLPDLVKAPFSGDLEFTEDEKKRIFELQDANKEDDLFRFLFFKQCNDLSRILPRLFENLEGHNSFSELLITLSFNDPNGVVYRLVNEVDERWFDIHTVDEDGKPIGQVQIIGWMYQYYNTEPKDKVFADLKKNIKISKQNIPAATQLFTPDWIVRYMVENSLGRLWYEGHPGFDKSEWKYYLDEAPQEPQVEQQLEDIRAQYAKMEPEQLKVIDPCMGSGHILCYLFDVLMQIYLDNGYSKREAVRSILENTLFGLDIDKRAAQIAYFSVMMKAREYDSDFFSRSNIPQPRVYDIQESNWLGGAYKHEMGNFLNSQQHRDTLNYLLDAFVDAKEYGSILQIKPLDYEGLKEAWETSAAATAHDANMAMWYDAAKDAVAQLIEQAVMLSQKYDAVVTNPPYMGNGGMNGRLSEYIKRFYPRSRSDLFAVCIERWNESTKPFGFNSMVTMQSWMSISSFEKMRENIILNYDIFTLLHMESMVLGIAFGTAATVIRNSRIEGFRGGYTYIANEDLINGEPKKFPIESIRNVFAVTDDYKWLPGMPISAYWVPKSLLELYKGKLIKTKFVAKEGVGTRNDEVFLKLFWEVRQDTIGIGKRWILTDKAGGFRKWYLGCTYVMDWENDGYRIKNYRNPDGSLRSRPQNIQYLYKDGVSWGKVGQGASSFRYRSAGFGFNDAAPTLFGDDWKPLIASLNSKIFKELLKIQVETLNVTTGLVENLPLLGYWHDENQSRVEEIVDNSILESKNDWNSFETSWDFKKHPLV